MSTTQRRIRSFFIRPRFQLRAIVFSLSTASAYVLLQCSILLFLTTTVSDELPEQSELLQGLLLKHMGLSLVVTFVILVPLTAALGAVLTHRTAGPLHRFEVYLEQLRDGENPGPCKLRRGDELQELCELLNQATEPLRSPEPAEREPVRTSA